MFAGIVAWFKRQFASQEAPPASSSWVEQPTELSGKSLDYLDEIFRDSFKREEESNESVWRSLPFFAAAVALAVNSLGRAAEDRPGWLDGIFAFSANLLFWLSVAAFAWTLRWFWELLRPRRYQYPPDNREIWIYAEDTRQFHVGQGRTGNALDDEVTQDLMAMMARQYGDAACTNMAHNRAKFQARSQLLLFILLGFFLVMVSEGTKYVAHAISAQSPEMPNVETPNEAARGETSGQDCGRVERSEAKAAVATLHRRGRGSDPDQRGTSGVGAMTDKPKAEQPSPPRPQPPMPQLVKKNDQTAPRPQQPPLEKR